MINHAPTKYHYLLKVVHQEFGVIDIINVVVEENKSPLQHLYIEGFNDVAQQFGDADFRKA